VTWLSEQAVIGWTSASSSPLSPQGPYRRPPAAFRSSTVQQRSAMSDRSPRPLKFAANQAFPLRADGSL